MLFDQSSYLTLSKTVSPTVAGRFHQDRVSLLLTFDFEDPVVYLHVWKF